MKKIGIQIVFGIVLLSVCQFTESKPLHWNLKQYWPFNLHDKNDKVVYIPVQIVQEIPKYPVRNIQSPVGYIKKPILNIQPNPVPETDTQTKNHNLPSIEEIQNILGVPSKSEALKTLKEMASTNDGKRMMVTYIKEHFPNLNISEDEIVPILNQYEWENFKKYSFTSSGNVIQKPTYYSHHIPSNLPTRSPILLNGFVHSHQKNIYAPVVFYPSVVPGANKQSFTFIPKIPDSQLHKLNEPIKYNKVAFGNPNPLTFSNNHGQIFGGNVKQPATSIKEMEPSFKVHNPLLAPIVVSDEVSDITNYEPGKIAQTVVKDRNTILQKDGESVSKVVDLSTKMRSSIRNSTQGAPKNKATSNVEREISIPQIYDYFTTPNEEKIQNFATVMESERQNNNDVISENSNDDGFTKQDDPVRKTPATQSFIQTTFVPTKDDSKISTLTEEYGVPKSDILDVKVTQETIYNNDKPIQSLKFNHPNFSYTQLSEIPLENGGYPKNIITSYDAPVATENSGFEDLLPAASENVEEIGERYAINITPKIKSNSKDTTIIYAVPITSEMKI